MGRSWTNDTQLKWLQARCGAFFKAQQAGRLDRFFTATHDAWFEVFPLHYADLTLPPGAPDANHNMELQKAITARKKQIVNWFKWNTRSARPSNGTPADSALLNALNGRNSQEPRKRAPQRIEAYVHLFRERVKAVVEQALVDVPEAHRLNVRRRTVSAMLLNESEEVHQRVNDYIHQWKVDQENEGKSAMEKASSTPSEFQAAIKQLPAYLRTACMAASEATGWTVFIAAGGPTPIANGTLHMQMYTFGPKSFAGNTFEQSHTDFEKGFSVPFSQYLKSCFPPSVCRERSLENPIPAVGSSSQNIDVTLMRVDNPPESDDESAAEDADDDDDDAIPDAAMDLTPDIAQDDPITARSDDSHGSATITAPAVPTVVRGNPVGRSTPLNITTSSATVPTAQHTPTPHDRQVPSSPIENAFARMALPAPADRQAPSSPIENAFARMALPAQPQDMATTNPRTDVEMSNIDPVLRSLSHSQGNSALLNQGLEGFIFNPGPSSVSRPSETTTRHDPLASAPSLAVSPLTLALSRRPAGPSVSSPEPTPNTTPAPKTAVPAISVPLSRITAMTSTPGPLSPEPIPIPPAAAAAAIPSTPASTIPTKTATLMASLITDYTLARPASGPALAAPINPSEPNSDQVPGTHASLSSSHKPPMAESMEPAVPNSAGAIVGENGADGRELTPAEKRALTRAKNKANKRPRWEYVTVEEVPAEKAMESGQSAG